MKTIAYKMISKYDRTMESSGWTFFTNHSHVLICLNNNPNRTVKDIALAIGITERSVLGILKDLSDGGILKVEKRGRRNAYKINLSATLRHPLEAHCQIGQILGTIEKNTDQNQEAK